VGAADDLSHALPSPVRLLLVDDHAVVRAGYRRLLEQQPGFQVVGEAASAEAAYELLQRCTADVVILDLGMPGEGGLAALRRYKLRWPRLPVLVISLHEHLSFAVQALRAGANGYFTKSSDPELIAGAVRQVLAGALALSPDIAAGIDGGAAGRRALPTLGLTVREFDIFRLIASGKSHEEIAGLLSVSTKTVVNLHSLIRQKLAIGSDIELYRLAVECGAVAAPGRHG
jgi:two-component system, NarL family, invasion response regulator UvrY